MSTQLERMAMAHMMAMADMRADGMLMVAVDLETAKRTAMWGTYGKNGLTHCRGNCPEHKLRYVRLIDCSTEHLQAIISTQPQVRGGDYEEIIRAILKDRGIE